MRNNIPVVKLGIIAVSRDCFPRTLSEMRRANIVKASGIYECPVTVENEKECRRICGEYVHAIRGGKAENIMGENSFTRGHFYRGVK